ncbi:MAG TPA: sulfite oxidase-like oxidoreductase [Dehalococcoidales bacterium]|nr:MAG: oxidoreductase [Chloroflexi bacterium RBG_16_60_22]HJX12448.1 sulfite oxidase-like oxidoreductase [Dehalococcoidales bacterium]
MEADIIKSPDTARKNRVPPGQKLTEKWPVLHYGTAHKIDVAGWTFKIFGLVEKERTLTWDEFRALPHVKVFSDIHCVTTWSKLDNLWEGVSTGVIRDLVSIKPEARYVMVHGAGGFTTNLSADDFFQPDVLLALKHDGRDILPEHGAPVRLVVPRLYFWKSAKWVTGIEFMAEERPGFWESNGYHLRGDPWKEERYSR